MPQASNAVAVLRSRNGLVDSLDTDVLCPAHGDESQPRPHDVALTLEDAIDIAEGDGLACDVCGAVLVEQGTPFIQQIPPVEG